MKFWVYLGLCFLLVPLQTTVLGRASTTLVEPDLILVAVCLIGLLTNELEGALMGILLGFIQDLFSAGVAFPNLVTKGLLGILAGLIGRQVVQVSSTVVAMAVVLLSSLSGLAFLYLARGHALGRGRSRTRTVSPIGRHGNRRRRPLYSRSLGPREGGADPTGVGPRRSARRLK